jgi:hypothetical protein
LKDRRVSKAQTLKAIKKADWFDEPPKKKMRSLSIGLGTLKEQQRENAIWQSFCVIDTDGQGISPNELSVFYNRMAPVLKIHYEMVDSCAKSLIETESTTEEGVWTYSDFKNFIINKPTVGNTISIPCDQTLVN